jgi:hypothetical protein
VEVFDSADARKKFLIDFRGEDEYVWRKNKEINWLMVG